MARGFLRENIGRREEIVTYINQLMVKRNWTQADLAKRLGMTQGMLSKRLSNFNFYLSELIEIFGLLGAEPDRVGKLMILKK